MQAKRRHPRGSFWTRWVLAILVGFGVDFAGFLLVAESIGRSDQSRLAVSAASLTPPPVPVPTPPTVEQPYTLATLAPSLPAAHSLPEAVAVPTPPVLATPAAPLQPERPLIESSDSSGNVEGRGVGAPGGVIALTIIGLLAWAWLRRIPGIAFKHWTAKGDAWVVSAMGLRSVEKGSES